jgi:hypothetical protein
MAVEQKAIQTKRVVLVGASIGKGWNFDGLGRRIQRPDYRFDYQGAFQFDKGEMIQDLIKSPDKPAIVLIKECSVYFPGDLNEYERQVTAWVDRLKASGIQPMLVTTVPVKRARGVFARLKDTIKGLLGKPSRQECLTSFNDWMTAYGRRAGVPVFDIESFLRSGADDRWLRADYDAGDGVHLNARAYGELDREFGRFLMNWESGSQNK